MGCVPVPGGSPDWPAKGGEGLDAAASAGDQAPEPHSVCGCACSTEPANLAESRSIGPPEGTIKRKALARLREPDMAANGPNAVLEHVRHLVNAEETRDLSDGQLLHLYSSQHNHEAFTVLLRRHERLVWNVCRCALRHDQDAEDAFQATFVVLARKAASICKRDSLASWLHGVAYRTALRARRDTTRRQARDRQARAMAHDHPVSEKAWNDLQVALTAEVERLPAKYKAPFVLCHLEGKSMAEAAQQLGWKAGTVSGRLTQARKLLEKGLARQGVALATALTAAAISQSTVS